MIPGKRYTSEVVLAIGWRRKWFILIPTVIVALIACGATYFLPNKYRAETTILVIPHRVPESDVGSTLTTKIGDRLSTINQQVRSRTRLERIIEDFNLYPERRKRDIMQDIVDDMSEDIDVDIVHGYVFRIAFSSDNPRTAMQVTERLGTFFIDESSKDRTMLAEDASEFLEAQVADAARKLRVTEQSITEYKRMHDGELERRQIGEQFRVLDPARVPERPFSPNRPILYLFGVVLALTIGVGAAAGAEYLDYGLRSEDDVRLALGLPVLATIPVIGTQKNMSLRAKVLEGSAGAAVALEDTAAQRDVEPACAAVPASNVSAPVPVTHIEQTEKLVIGLQDGLLSDQFRRLAAVLHHAQHEREARSIMIASAVPSEGKSLTAANLALTLGRSYGKRVLLIDTDLRRPSLHTLFNVSNRVGLMTLLSDAKQERLPVAQVDQNLWLLPAGLPSPNRTGVVTSPAMKQLLADAVTRFDWVILDTPPVGLMPDANLLAAMVDAALVVVHAGKTPYPLVGKAVDAIGLDRVLGVVLNLADRSAAVDTYGYGYYDDYGDRPHSDATGRRRLAPG